MDWTLAIEKNREALKRIVAMLVAMAELGNGQSAIGSRQPGSGTADGPTTSDCLLPTAYCRPTLPRHLHRAVLRLLRPAESAVLRLLRPAESAVRRLIIVMARGLVVTLAPLRPRKPKPASIFLTKPGGTGIYLPPGVRASALPSPLWRGVRGPTAGTPLLVLLDPLKRSFRRHRPVANGIARISLPGVTAPSPIQPRRPPAPDDPLDATRLAHRLAALGAALDDLPGQARRFAGWRARKHMGRTRRIWPLRPGRPPGQRSPNRRTHEVYDILNDLHGLAFDVLEHPDTS